MSRYKLNDLEKITYRKKLKSPTYVNYVPRPGDNKSTRYKYNKNNLNKHFFKIF